MIESGLHLRYEGKKRFRNNPEFAKEFQSKGIEAAKEWHSSEEGKKWHSKHGEYTWRNRKRYTKECKNCGKEYETPFPKRSKFCHNNCKSNYRYHANKNS